VPTVDSATLLKLGDSKVEALNSQQKWAASTVSYSFDAALPSDYVGESSNSTLSGNLTTGWQAFTPTLKKITVDIMTSVDELIATGKDAVMAVSSTDEVYAIASTSALNDQKGVDLVLNKDLRPTQFASLSGNDAMTAKLTVCLDGCGKFIVSDSDLDMCPSCSASLDKVTDARITSHCMSEDVPHSEGGLVSMPVRSKLL
jgi:hypothetical protein